jgi:hypothetical protein
MANVWQNIGQSTFNKLFLVAAVAGAVTSITQVHTVCDFHQSNAALAIFIVKTVPFFVSQ